MKHLLEIAVFSIEGALAADRGGADRIELCDGFHDGGTTPSYGKIKTVKQHVEIPVNVMIRPRGGDFLYSDLEFECMQADIERSAKLGAEGLVFGILLADGRVDVERCKRLLDFAWPRPVTFHRAFDMCPDPFEALETLVELGFACVLTSGGKPTALEGAERIHQLIEIAGKRIRVMPGAGISSSNIASLHHQCNAAEYHASAKNVSHYSVSEIGMGASVVADELEVRKIKDLLRTFDE